jgi:hypothetical protein
MECTVASQEHVGEIYLFETTVWWSIWVEDAVEIGTRVSASALKRPVRGVTARQHKKVYENRSVTKFDRFDFLPSNTLFFFAQVYMFKTIISSSLESIIISAHIFVGYRPKYYTSSVTCGTVSRATRHQNRPIHHQNRIV